MKYCSSFSHLSSDIATDLASYFQLYKYEQSHESLGYRHRPKKFPMVLVLDETDSKLYD